MKFTTLLVIILGTSLLIVTEARRSKNEKGIFGSGSKEEGATCSYKTFGSQCKDGLTCLPAEQQTSAKYKGHYVCKKEDDRLGKGEYCQGGNQCLKGLTCRKAEDGDKKCLPKRKNSEDAEKQEGEACKRTWGGLSKQGNCAKGLICKGDDEGNSTCKPKKRRLRRF